MQCSTWPLKVGYVDLPCRRLFNIWHCAPVMAHAPHLNNMNYFIQPCLLTTLGLYGKRRLPYSVYGGRKTKIILTFSLFFCQMWISPLRQRRYAYSPPCLINYINVPGHLFIHLGGGVPLNFRHRASCILGQAFRYSPENAFYIFNQQIYFIIWYLLDRASLIWII